LKLASFFSRHPVFTVRELDGFLAQRGTGNRRTRDRLLAYHQEQRHILRVRRGLYAVVPPGGHPDTCPVDPYLLAARMTDDAVLGYHTALEFHGRAHSAFERLFYLSARRSLPAVFRSCQYRCVLFAKALRDRGQENFGVALVERAGIHVRVTSLERTLVDVLDRPDLGGGWEEVWRSLESVEFFDPDVVVRYAVLLGNATTAAKVGFFLDQHREALMLDDAHLEPLRERLPRSRHYLTRSTGRPGRLVAEWNLIVPVELLERSWAVVT
jgi:predicted transcriptional regulator of viral defense system